MGAAIGRMRKIETNGATRDIHFSTMPCFLALALALAANAPRGHSSAETKLFNSDAEMHRRITRAIIREPERQTVHHASDSLPTPEEPAAEIRCRFFVAPSEG